MSNFIPNFVFNSVTDINIDFLKKNNIKAILLDVDDTIAEHNSMYVEDNVIDWLNSLTKNDIEILLFSNNDEKRVAPLAKKLSLDYIYLANKPMIKNYLLAQKKLHKKKENIACVGDQIFTDIYGSNRYNLTSIYVMPISSKSNSWFLNLKRKIEKIYIKKYYKGV